MSASTSSGRDPASYSGWDNSGASDLSITSLTLEVITVLFFNWVFYFFYLAVVLIVSRSIRNRNKTNDYKSSVQQQPVENSGDPSLDLDPVSLTFTDRNTQLAYQKYVRKHILPPVNNFMAIVMLALGFVKLSRLFESEEPLNPHMFKPVPKIDIINNASTSLHVSLFFIILRYYEAGERRKAWKCKCKSDKWWSLILETVEATKFLLFFGMQANCPGFTLFVVDLTNIYN